MDVDDSPLCSNQLMVAVVDSRRVAIDHPRLLPLAGRPVIEERMGVQQVEGRQKRISNPTSSIQWLMALVAVA